MQVAEYLANAFEAELILGDARISETIKKLKHSYAETLRQILNPFKWKKLIEKILKSLFAVIGGGIGFRDVFDPAILLSGPIAILRYFIAAVKHRSIVLVLFGFSFFHLWMNGATSDLAQINGMEKSANLIMSVWLGASSLFTILTLNAMITVLLDDRNRTLAKAIQRQCRLARSGEVVVAVLGMAHCSGVKKLMLRNNASADDLRLKN
mmetsp:Transcript_6042/g.9381  ORF Transcript_6042/g.9381 Transcript_6042/m.9381 type:complete len:209 (-) Transcript_6042:272-898(-)